MRDWDTFREFVFRLPSELKLKPGRPGIRVVRDHLQALVEAQVLPNLNDSDTARLFPLGFSPAESDLKAAAGLGLERGYITPSDYEAALRRDKAAGPFGFLQSQSPKILGETVAPQIAEYWLRDEGDRFIKKPPSDLYDIRWDVADAGRSIRFELKASSEDSPLFQQIRRPRMTNPDAADYEYDSLICLHVSNAGLEWWGFPAAEVDELIASGAFRPQHGGQKMKSDTYWVRMTKLNRQRFASRQTTSDELREYVKGLD